MKKFYNGIVNHPKLILTVFSMFFVICFLSRQFIGVNYDMNDYLPPTSASTAALDVMEQEYEGGIPNARIMLENVSVPEVLEYKSRIREIEGVSDVTWLDDAADITEPLEMMDKDVVETYYKDGNALLSVTIEKDKRIRAVEDIRELIGEEHSMMGSAVSTAAATTSTVSEIRKIAVIGTALVLVILLFTTTSWAEPFIILAGLGVAVTINAGSNLIFGEISFVTNAAGNILQLAVSLDYSVFLIHRFEECRKKDKRVKKAMVNALCMSTTSILSSGLTTVIGFLALCLMRFEIGADLGLALAKGILISLITVFVFMPVFILYTYRLIDKTSHRSFMPSFQGFGKAVFRVMIPMMCVFVIFIVPCYLGSNANDFYYGASHIFGADTKLGSDTQKIDGIFGESDTYVLLVPKESTATQKKLSGELKSLPQVTGVMSYVDTVGAEIPESYLDTQTLSKLNSDHYTRMVLSVAADYEGEETFELVEKIRGLAEKYYKGGWYLAGEGVSTYDLMNTVTSDMVKVNTLAVGAVFFVLLLTTRTVILPLLLVLAIETAIWINLSIPYFTDQPIFYIAYLIISSVQLGATVDYAILLSDRYKEEREKSGKKRAVINTISAVTVSVLTSGGALTIVGFLLGNISTHGLLSQLGFFLGKGTLCSLAIVLFVLPALLYVFDGLFIKNTGKIRRRSKMKTYKKSMALFLAALMAAGTSIPVLAADDSSSKEEVVYIMAGADGAVEGVHVVNIFPGGDITDYGDYSSVKMLTTTDAISQTGNRVTFSSDAEKVYYQGTLQDKEIPWNISIRYFLDGREYSPAEIAGKSGSLEIKISITENKKCKGSYFDDYALQAAFVFDTNLCGHIRSDGATAANVGADKQLLYTVLPGKGLETSVYAQVKDFEMDAVSVNGIKLSLNVDIDDEELTEKAAALMEAAGQLDDGASKLYGGTEDLKTGSGSLDKGISSMNSGIGELDSGIAALQTGMKSMQAGLRALNSQSSALTEGGQQIKTGLETVQKSLTSVSVTADQLEELVSVSGEIKSGINRLSEGATSLKSQLSYEQYKAALLQNGLDIDALKDKNQQAAADCSGQIESLKQMISELEEQGGSEEQAARLKAQAESLENMIRLLKADNAAMDGTENYLNRVSEGAGSLYSGAAALQAEYEKFDAAVSELASKLGGMAVKMSELTGGIDKLVTSYKEFDKGLNRYTDGVAEVANGYGQMMEGISSLAVGSRKLLAGSDGLTAGSAALYDGVVSLCDGAKELNDGTGKLNSETAQMDTKLQDKVDEILSSIEGEKTEPKSFASGKNGTVSNVQFVIKTAAVEKEEPEVEETEEPESKTLWQKFVRLFGFCG